MGKTVNTINFAKYYISKGDIGKSWIMQVLTKPEKERLAECLDRLIFSKHVCTADAEAYAYDVFEAFIKGLGGYTVLLNCYEKLNKKESIA